MSLLDSDLLKGIDPGAAEEILALGDPVAVAKGHRVFELGSEAEKFSLVVEGTVYLSLPILLGEEKEELPVETRGPGQLLGWSALVPPNRFKLTGTAVSDVHLHQFSGEGFLEYLSLNPEVGYAVMSNLARLIGNRLEVFQAMWLREMQYRVETEDELSTGRNS